MALEILFHPEALREAVDAARYYADHAPVVGAALK